MSAFLAMALLAYVAGVGIGYLLFGMNSERGGQ